MDKNSHLMSCCLIVQKFPKYEIFTAAYKTAKAIYFSNNSNDNQNISTSTKKNNHLIITVPTIIEITETAEAILVTTKI